MTMRCIGRKLAIFVNEGTKHGAIFQANSQLHKEALEKMRMP